MRNKYESWHLPKHTQQEIAEKLFMIKKIDSLETMNPVLYSVVWTFHRAWEDECTVSLPDDAVIWYNYIKDMALTGSFGSGIV